MDEGWCRIHVDGPASVDVLREAVATITGGSADAYGVRLAGAELLVEEADEHSPDATRRFPGGFIHFAYHVEVLPEGGVPLELVGTMLKGLWDRGWAAVAVCDYEDQLPHAGGSNDESLPWPV
jgi:hypothetical protein